MTAIRLLAAMMLLIVPAALTSCKDMSQLAAEIAKAMDDIQAGEEEDAWPEETPDGNQTAPAEKAYELPSNSKLLSSELMTHLTGRHGA